MTEPRELVARADVLAALRKLRDRHRSTSLSAYGHTSSTHWAGVVRGVEDALTAVYALPAIPPGAVER